jgi:hypothetical protein
MRFCKEVQKLSFLKELPEWFNLDNYHSLESLTPNELQSQIEHRFFILNTLDGYDDNGNSTPLYESFIGEHRRDLECIWDGSVCIDEEYFGEPYFTVITPLSSQDAISHYHLLKDNGYFDGDNKSKYECDLLYFATNDLYTENKKLDPKGDSLFTNGYSVNIDLNTYTNKEILDYLKKSLPEWRKKTDCKQPTREQLINKTYKRKVLQYKVIPLIDLITWQAIHGKKVSRKVIFSGVFNDYIQDEPISDKKYDEVVNPFIIKCVGENRVNSNPDLFNLFQLKPFHVNTL